MTAVLEPTIARSSRRHRPDWLYPAAAFSVGAVTGSFERVLGLEALLTTGLQLVVVGLLFSRYARAFRLATSEQRAVGAALIHFVIVSLLSCLMAQAVGRRSDAMEMWRHAAQVYFCVLIFWGCASWAYQGFAIKSIDIGVIVTASLCCMSVLLDFMGLTNYESYGSRYFGFLGDSVAWLLSFCFVYLYFRKGFWLLWGLCAMSLLMTGSRGALFVVLGSFVIYCFISGDRLAVRLRRILPLLILITIATSAGLAEKGFSRFSGLDPVENDRVQTALFTASIFWESPVLGSGYGVHSVRFRALGIPKDVPGVEFSATPSNPFLQLLAESGVIGFLFWLVFVVLLLRVCWKLIRSSGVNPQAQAVMGIALWLMAFFLSNQSAAWILPASKLLVLVFSSAGVVVGMAGRCTNPRRLTRSPPASVMV